MIIKPDLKPYQINFLQRPYKQYEFYPLSGLGIYHKPTGHIYAVNGYTLFACKADVAADDQYTPVDIGLSDNAPSHIPDIQAVIPNTINYVRLTLSVEQLKQALRVLRKADGYTFYKSRPVKLEVLYSSIDLISKLRLSVKSEDVITFEDVDLGYEYIPQLPATVYIQWGFLWDSLFMYPTNLHKATKRRDSAKIFLWLPMRSNTPVVFSKDSHGVYSDAFTVLMPMKKRW